MVKVLSASLRRRTSRSLVTILLLSMAHAVIAPVFLPGVASNPAAAATLISNVNNFLQWNTWMGGANHRPYINKTQTQISSNGDEIKLTSKDSTTVFNDQFSASGYLWNTNESTGDFSVTADYWFGNNEGGADAIGFTMRPLSSWPSGGTLGASGGSHSGWGLANEVSVIFDTWQNNTEIDDDHLTIISRNSSNVQTDYTGNGLALKDESGNPDTNIEDGLWHTYTINWNFDSKLLKVYSGTLGGTQHQIASYTMLDQTASGYHWGWVGLTGGATSDFVVKNVVYNEPVKFTQHPSSVTTTVGSQVTFSTAFTSVEATPTIAKWQYSTDGGTNWIDAGVTATTLTVTASRDLSQRQYRYYVSNTAANEIYTKISNVATLEVVGASIETDTALDLNGTSQYAWAADSGLNGVFDIKGTLTMEAWVFPTQSTAGTQYTVICKSEAYQLFHIDGIWKYSLMGSTSWGSGVSTLVPVELNEWHHIALSRTGNVVTFYYDGVAVFDGGSNTAGSGNINDSSFPFAIGGMAYNGPTLQYGFKGMIDHVAIYNVYVADTVIKSDMNRYIPPSTAYLKFFYDMNKGSESVLYNRASTALSASDLSLVGSPKFEDVKIESSTNSYKTIKFPRSYITANGGWQVPAGLTSASALIVGGGGGGGWNSGGGGGGGGYLYLSSMNFSGIVGVQVGVGGRGGRGADSSGAPTYMPADGSSTVFNGTTVAGGNKGTVFNLVAGGAGVTTASGTSGSGGTGGATNGTAGSNGGAGFTQTNFGETLIYSAGGGGGGYNAAGGVGGGNASSGAGNGGGTVTTTGTDAVANRGGGGGASSARVNAGQGGSGVVIVKFFIAASKPVFSGPFNDTTTAGLTETFTVTGSPDAPMVRSYQWQVSVDTGTSWAAPTQGSGSTTASYVTPVLTTSMSGRLYQYRVIVTDTDTAGARITETSTPVFLIINAALTISGNSTISKAINVAKVETFTVTGGTATHRYSLTPTISGITLDTSTALSPVIRISDTKTVGTYYETLTVTDSVSVSVSLPLTIQVIAPPSFSASSEQVVSGTLLDLDPGSSASYTGSGTTWRDLAGRAANANLAHAFGTTATYADGSTRTGVYSNITCEGANFNAENFGSFEFTTVGQCIYATNSIPVATVTPLPVYTVSTWIKRNGPQSAWRSVICNPYRIASDQIIYCLFWTGTNTLNAGVFNGGAWQQTTAVVVPDLTWVYATVTYNGSNSLSLYLNDTATGYSNASVSATWASNKINTGLIIGRKWDNVDTFNGSVGQIRIYDRILTSTEIAQNYNATKSRFLNTSNKVAPTKKYGTLVSDTYTVTSGSGSISVTLARNLESALKWDTSTARSTRLSAQESLTVGTYTETVTATDALGQSVYLPIRYTVTQADTLTISMDTPTVVTFNNSQITIFPKPVYKGLVGVDTLTVTTKFSSSAYTLSDIRPTNADTYTVRATDPIFTVGAASNYLNVVYESSTAVVNKARQAALNPSIYGASIGSSFPLSLLGGSGDGAVTETLTGVSTAPNCAINARSLSSSTTSVAYCTVTFTKASSQNYLSESITVQIYFMSYVINQPAPAAGSGPNIALTGESDVTVDLDLAPMISSLSTYTATAGVTVIQINGVGFNGSDPLFEIRFWRGINGTGFTINPSKTEISVTVPAGAKSGKVSVITSKGLGISELPLVITP